MRPEKKFLVDEVNSHLDKSEYLFLTNYHTITVDEIASLRDSLSKVGAEFHVIKNTILDVAVRAKGMPDLGEHLVGTNAIVVGGDQPSEVAKILRKFAKDKDKNQVKAGVFENSLLSSKDVEALADLPAPEVLKAQLLGLLNTPAQRMVSVLNAVPSSVVTLLQAKVDKENAA